MIYDHRSMVITLAVREIKLKYIQSKLGLLWSVVQPISALLLYTLFFTYVLKVEFTEYPFVFYVFSGIVPWTLFNYLLNQGSMVLIQNQEIIRKISFPKFILVLVKAVVGLVEILPALIILIGMMLFYSVPIQLNLIILPFVIVLNLLVALVIPIWISALSVNSRDLTHIVPYLANFGIWLTPVFWVPESSPYLMQVLAQVNPITFILEVYRWALFGSPIDLMTIWSFLVAVMILLPIGLLIYKRKEKTIIDVI